MQLEETDVGVDVVGQVCTLLEDETRNPTAKLRSAKIEQQKAKTRGRPRKWWVRPQLHANKRLTVVPQQKLMEYCNKEMEENTNDMLQ